MCATSSARRDRERVAKPSRGGALPAQPRMVAAGASPASNVDALHSCVDLGDSTRLALMITPQGPGGFREQAPEALSALRAMLDRHPESMAATVLTVFLKDPGDQAACAQLLASLFNPEPPVTNYVLQPPCNGAALALEAWAIGGKSVRVERFGPHTLSVAYDGVRWICCAGCNCASRHGPVKCFRIWMK